MALTLEQQQAVENDAAIPVYIGNAECIIVREDICGRVKAILYDDGELTDEEALRIGWDTPEMAEYGEYDLHRTTAISSTTCRRGQR
jgi:hypothetical protein